MKMAVFWDVAPCSLVDIDQRFRGAYGLLNFLSPEEGSENNFRQVVVLIAIRR
jgi:hypothetical protein